MKIVDLDNLCFLSPLKRRGDDKRLQPSVKVLLALWPALSWVILTCNKAYASIIFFFEFLWRGAILPQVLVRKFEKCIKEA